MALRPRWHKFAPPPEESPRPLKTAAETELADAEIFAKMEGVSIEIALARLRAQPLIGELSASLQKQTNIAFGGLWVEPGKEKVLHIAVKNLPGAKEADSIATIRRQVDQKLGGNAGIDRVEYHTVAYTYDELVETQAKLSTFVEAAKLQIAKYIVTPKNTLRVMGTQTDIERLIELSKEIHLPVAYDEAAQNTIFEFVTDNEPPSIVDDTVVYGGLPMYDYQGGYCTSSFAIWGISPDPSTHRIMTAGHCPNDLIQNGLYLSFRVSYLGGMYDYQWHAPPNMPTNYVRNLVWNGSFDRVILGQMNVSNMYWGMGVCKYGVTTGYGCSYLDALNADFTNNGLYFYGFIGTPVNTFSGDSGGPLMVGNTAYGVYKGRFNFAGSGHSMHMPVQRINNNGQQLITWWIP